MICYFKMVTNVQARLWLETAQAEKALASSVGNLVRLIRPRSVQKYKLVALFFFLNLLYLFIIVV